MTSKIYVSLPLMTGIELDYIKNSTAENWISSFGPNIDKFEDSIKQYLDSESKVTALN